MGKRSKDYIRGRKSVLSEDQVADLQSRRTGSSSSERSRSFKRLVPLLVFGLFAFVIAKEEIPAVNDAWERMVYPEEWIG